MRFIAALLFTLSAACFAQDTTFTCDNEGNCTATSIDVSTIKTGGTASASSIRGSLGTGSNFGTVSAPELVCDSKGVCTQGAGTVTGSLNDSFGTLDSTASGSTTEGLSGSYTQHTSTEISCSYHRAYTLGSGAVIYIEGCVLDTNRNVTKVEARVCHNYKRQDGCDPDDASMWSPNAVFTPTTMPQVTNSTATVDPQVIITMNCQSNSPKCRMDVTTEVELNGTMQELGEQTYNNTNDPDQYLNGQQMSKRLSENPVYQAMESGVGDDMVDCAQNNMFGYADDGYLLSCDGANMVTMSATCTDVAVCVA